MFTHNVWMNMFLYYIFFLDVLIFPITKAQPNNTTHTISLNEDLQLPKGLSIRLNRTRREDKLKHTAVCAELDRTEDTAFMAVITTKNYGRLLCVGSILDEYHVLTARNCFDKSDAAALTIIAGYQSPYWGRNSQVKFAEKIIRHKDKELAVIVLQKPFEFSETVKPIKVIGPEKMNEPFETSYPSPYAVVGFEVPEYLEQPSLIPRTISYHMIDEKFEICNDTCHKFDENSKDLYFCSDGTSGFGWGGIGSPTVIPLQKEFVLVGVLWNYRCTHLANGTATQPGNQPRNQPGDKNETQPGTPPQTPPQTLPGTPPGTPPQTQNQTQPGTPPQTQNQTQPGTEPRRQKREDPPTHNVHIRADRFYKWIKANSYQGR